MSRRVTNHDQGFNSPTMSQNSHGIYHLQKTKPKLEAHDPEAKRSIYLMSEVECNVKDACLMLRSVRNIYSSS